jgi:hypothetical protein
MHPGLQRPPEESVAAELTPTGKRILHPEAGHRLRELRQTDPYWSHWVAFRRMRRRAVVATLLFPVGAAAFLPVAALADYLLEGFGRGTWLENLPLWSIRIAFVVLILGPWIQWAVVKPCQWTCPRCSLAFVTPGSFGQPVHRGTGASNVNPFWPLVQLCVNCGLPKWAPRDPDE